jgi:hypothetical protein
MHWGILPQRFTIDSKQLQIQPNTSKWTHFPNSSQSIHDKWSWDSNYRFQTYHTEAFETTIIHYQNLTTITSINAAVEEYLSKTNRDN